MTGLLILLGLPLAIVWIWQFLKAVDTPATNDDKDFWQNLYFTGHHGPDDTF